MLSVTHGFIILLLLLGFLSPSALSGNPVFDLTLEERILLQKQEPGLRNAVEQAVEEHGDSSQEKATALNRLGGVLYKLEKYAGLRSAAKEIARIEEHLHGPDTKKLAMAMRNIGSVAFRLELHEESLRYMMRALNILLQHFEADSQEVTMHKSIMMTFEQHEEYLKTPLGMTYKQFKKVEKNLKEFEFVLDEL